MTDVVARCARRWAAALAVVLAVASASCSAEEDAPAPERTTSAATPPATASPPPTPPKAGRCYRLNFAQALSPTSTANHTPCPRSHTAETYAVGRLDTVVDGHLLAVDSARVQAQVAETCPAELARFVGGDTADLRLSMIRSVWFTPSVEESDEGANWYRCDAVVVAGDEKLAESKGTLQDALDDPATLERYAMCGTSAPDEAQFERVTCASDHSWRAIDVVPYEEDSYPGEATVRDRLEEPCENAGLDAAADPLDYEWGFEYPTREQWEMGQTYGLCWAPD